MDLNEIYLKEMEENEEARLMRELILNGERPCLCCYFTPCAVKKDEYELTRTACL